MPRGPRIDYPGLLHHVIVRGMERKNIFQDEKDYKDFIGRIEKVIARTETKIYAWSLMSNHVHLLIKIREKPLSEIMRRILTGYAISYNRRHKRVGYLYQGRYKSIVCEEEQYLLELLRYIHLNPVRAGIIKTIIELDKYSWTGHHNLIIGKEVKWQETKEILIKYSKRKKLAVKRYKKFITDGMKQGKREDLSGGGLIRSLGGIGNTMLVRRENKQMYDQRILGNGSFVEDILKDAEKKEKIVKKMSIEELISRIGKYYKIEPKKLINIKNNKEINIIKAVLINIGKNQFGIKGAILAKRLNMDKSRISRLNCLGEKIIKSEKNILTEILD